MKKPARLILILTLLFIYSSCKKALKNVEDYYPVVKTVSATVAADGSVDVVAEISSAGSKPLKYTGFCVDTLPVPDMMSNQTIVTTMDGNLFRTSYSMSFDPDKTYYFRSWAANDNGYAYGNVISLAGIKATPIDVPCSIALNTSGLGINGNTMGTISGVSTVDYSPFTSTWNVSTSSFDDDAGDLYFQFGSELKTKVYTATSGSASGDLVTISISSGFSNGIVKDGSKVYVNQKAAGVFEITICDATWTIDGYSDEYTLRARFISPY